MIASAMRVWLSAALLSACATSAPAGDDDTADGIETGLSLSPAKRAISRKRPETVLGEFPPASRDSEATARCT